MRQLPRPDWRRGLRIGHPCGQMGPTLPAAAAWTQPLGTPRCRSGSGDDGGTFPPVGRGLGLQPMLLTRGFQRPLRRNAYLRGPQSLGAMPSMPSIQQQQLQQHWLERSERRRRVPQCGARLEVRGVSGGTARGAGGGLVLAHVLVVEVLPDAARAVCTLHAWRPYGKSA